MLYKIKGLIFEFFSRRYDLYLFNGIQLRECFITQIEREREVFVQKIFYFNIVWVQWSFLDKIRKTVICFEEGGCYGLGMDCERV